MRKARHKGLCFVSLFIGNTQTREIHRDRKQISGCQGLAGGGAGERRVTASWVQISFRGGENVPEPASDDSSPTLHIY